MLVKMPGWKPKELGGSDMPKPVTTQTFHKYDTEIPSGLNYYILVQFIIILIGSTVFLKVQGTPDYDSNMPFKLAVVSFIIVSLLSIGGIFEKRAWVPVIEYGRIIVLCGAVLFLLKDTPQFIVAGIVATLITIVSLAWFSRYRNEFKAMQASA
jgi:hypothetical protein